MREFYIIDLIARLENNTQENNYKYIFKNKSVFPVVEQF